METIQCLIVDDEKVAREIIESHLKKLERFQVAASCKNVAEAVDLINSKNIDLVFLDIHLPEVSGLSLAKLIPADIKIIFTTAYREYALEGFELQAVDYLLKPISFQRMLQAVNKYMGEQNPHKDKPASLVKTERSEFIFVRSNRKMIRVDFKDILFIESLSDYVKIYLSYKLVVSRESISNLELKLPQHQFIRVHRSFIVAISHIDFYTHESIHVGEHEIPISRGYKYEVFKRLKFQE